MIPIADDRCYRNINVEHVNMKLSPLQRHNTENVKKKSILLYSPAVKRSKTPESLLKCQPIKAHFAICVELFRFYTS